MLSTHHPRQTIIHQWYLYLQNDFFQDLANDRRKYRAIVTDKVPKAPKSEEEEAERKRWKFKAHDFHARNKQRKEAGPSELPTMATSS